MSKGKNKFYITVGSGLLLLSIAVVVYFKVKSNKNINIKNDNGSGKGGNNGNNAAPKPSFELFVYKDAADSIFTLLDGCENILNYKSPPQYVVVKTIKEKVKNAADWVELVKAFGSRDVDNCGILTGSTRYTLPELLKDQLVILTSTKYLDDLQAYLKSLGIIL